MRTPRPPAAIYRFAVRLARDSRGGSAIEYGLILAIVVLGTFAALLGLADVTTGMWRDIAAKVTAASK
ncbi:hypothetical protein ASG29_10955 [Sphingomonas sp. Leaf412]|uniref:Flp family type IVb pilin n=1 Tax=Sphingomonas sp. Leaf412 TaxID=1736370 RepID=UPI0006FDD558|nr:hypothetical protein [Sphingomonas sp. Leaf412]KQT32320.1 hypothetical protein ASG29_10955 [Sphingomonas sp. Leaf412]